MLLQGYDSRRVIIELEGRLWPAATEPAGVLRGEEARARDQNHVGREVREDGGFDPALPVEVSEGESGDAVQGDGAHDDERRDRHEVGRGRQVREAEEDSDDE